MSDPEPSTLEAIVGKRWEYYAPRFERFERGEWLSWNWAAFFATLAWLRYRRLYAWSWAYCFVSTPFLLALLLFVAAAGDACERALDPASPELARYFVLAVIACGWILPPLLANRVYFGHVRALAAQPDADQGTGKIAGAVALQAFVLLGAAVLGPSHENYRYRAMVGEGVSMAAAARGVVEGYLREHRSLPARIEDLVGPQTAGRYVQRITLEPDGTVRAVFGAKGGKLAGRSVMFVPQRKDGAIVTWHCRSADIPPRCLPAACR